MKKKRDLEGNRLHHFELSDKNRAVRWSLVIILLVIAAVALTAGLKSALYTPAGWQTVRVNTTALNCGDEFVLQYELGAGETSATAEKKALEAAYGKIVENAWKLFFNEAGDTDLQGMHTLNLHPNEQITVDAGLYPALEQIVNSGNRALYLAPVYAEYNRVFYSESEAFAREFDPGQNEEQRAYVQLLANYANDPLAIELVLCGENQVVLQVSQEYLSFAKENELRHLVDFGWLRNAFIVDYIASELTKSGFTNGSISSVDGFARNMDQRGNPYSLNLFNRVSEGIDLAAVMDYTAPKSLVTLRNYPMYALEDWRYYSFSDGRIVTAMIDPVDGQSKSSLDNLVSYSPELSAGELALAVMPVYVADTFSEDALNALATQGIYSVWFQGTQVRYNQSDLKVTVNDPYHK